MKYWMLFICTLVLAIFFVKREAYSDCHLNNQELHVSDKVFYFQGLVRDRCEACEDLTIVNLECSIESESYSLVNAVISTDADVMCLFFISESLVAEVYEGLQWNYSHFLYSPTGGVLIASKYSLEGVQLTGNKLDTHNEETLEFSIFNKERFLCGIQTPLAKTRAPMLKNRSVSLLSSYRKDLLVRNIRLYKKSDEGEAGGSVTIGFDATWGDGNGIKVEGYLAGEVHDSHGNEDNTKR